MDRELDYWVCDQLKIPRKEFTWDDVIFYKIATSMPMQPEELKKWPKRDKNQYGSMIMRVLTNRAYEPGKYRARCAARYRFWNGTLCYSFGKARRWQQARPLSEQYLVLIKQIMKYKLTYEQCREAHFNKVPNPQKGWVITNPEVNYSML